MGRHGDINERGFDPDIASHEARYRNPNAMRDLLKAFDKYPDDTAPRGPIDKRHGMDVICDAISGGYVMLLSGDLVRTPEGKIHLKGLLK